jgi:hypothetical protein
VKQPLGAAIAVALALTGCGSGGTKTVTVTSTSSSSSFSFSTTAPTSSATTGAPTTSTATSTSSSTTATVNLATFKSPSGNIGCMIIGGGARCDIRQRTWSPPPRPARCPNIVDFGQGLAVDRSGSARFVCAGDTVMDPSATVLPYNTDTVVGEVSCASSANGMSCTNTRTGHGFFIAIQGYRIF